MTPQEQLIQELIQQGYLKSPRIIEAFRAIDRADFVPQEVRGFASMNEALPIGQEQTISQPQVVAFMLELLQPQAGEKILDVGAGSGWTTALLAHLVGETGKVVGVEIREQLAEFGRENVAKYGFFERDTASILSASGTQTFPEFAPFDKILASAALQGKKIPGAWNKQLKNGGVIVFPMKESIWKFTKTNENTFVKEEHPGFVFVPFQD